MTISLAVPVDSLKKVRTESYTDCVLWSTLPSEAGRPPWQSCHKGTNLNIARTLPAVAWGSGGPDTGSAQGIGYGTLKLSRDCVHIVRYGIGGREAEE